MPPTLRPRLVRNIPSQLHRRSRKTKAKGWFDLPFEMREEVMDKMDPATRCKLSRCSVICREETINSKNYMFGLELARWKEVDQLRISFYHGKDDFLSIFNRNTQFSNFATMSFCYEFMDARNDQTIVIYRKHTLDENVENDDIRWVKVENGKPTEVRCRYFKDYTFRYKNSLREIVIDYVEPHIDFNLHYCKRLEHISSSEANVIQRGMFSLTQVIKAKLVKLKKMNFTFDEILLFEGTVYEIECDQFDIKKYLRMKKNGEVHENMTMLTVNFDKIIVNQPDLTEGLDAFDLHEYRSGEYSFCCKFKTNCPRKEDYKVYVSSNLFTIINHTKDLQN